MALATQCPFCQTTFRVANDQLKLRGGLVRCGHCHEVFDGNAALLPDQQSPGNWPPPPPIEPPPAITPAIARANAAAPNYGAPPADVLPDPDAMVEIESAWDLPPSLRPDDFALPDGKDANDADDAADALAIEAETEAETEIEIDTVPLLLQPSSAPHDSDRAGEPDSSDQSDDADNANNVDNANETDDADDIDPAAEQPTFIRSAQRRQRWARARRIVTIVLCIVLLFAGLAQGAYLGRNRIAAAVPALKPLLNAACRPLRCNVGLERQIDQLSIDANELQVAEPGQPALTLNLLLRNRSESSLAWPDIELTLNDDDEKALIRRVFTPADYLPPTPTQTQTIAAGFAADAEQSVKLSFTMTQGAASGYRVYLFYP